MDTPHGPFGPPPRGTENFFLGHLSFYLEEHGQITPQDWASALESAYSFQREQRNQNSTDLGL